MDEAGEMNGEAAVSKISLPGSIVSIVWLHLLTNLTIDLYIV